MNIEYYISLLFGQVFVSLENLMVIPLDNSIQFFFFWSIIVYKYI